jgi:uncharacterized membrane protein YhfC
MVSTAVLFSVAGAAILPAVWVAGVYLACRRRMRLSRMNVAAGAAVFVLFALAIEGSLNSYLLARNPDTASWFAGHKLALVFYGIAAASMFEEVGRALAMRLLVRPTGNPGTAVAYGIGHGGIEAVIIGSIAQVQILIMAMMLNAGTLEAKLRPLTPPATLDKIRASLEHLSIGIAAIASIERLTALLTQIALSLLMWRAVSARSLGLLVAAIALHAAADLPAALAKVGYIPGAAAEGVYALLGSALLVALLLHLPSRSDPASAPSATAKP